MTVKELRDKLATLPDDLIVVQPRCQASSVHEALWPAWGVSRQQVLGHEDLVEGLEGSRTEMLVIE